MNIFFTSDIHFGHKRILEFCPERGEKWTDIKEMNEAIVSNWNKTVGQSDLVFFLGDLSFYHKSKDTRSITDRLNGNLIFVQGNHDSSRVLRQISPMVFDSLVYRIGNQHIAMAHRPNDVPMTKNVTFGLCGHVHQHWKFQTEKIMVPNSKPDEGGLINYIPKSIPVPIINVGVDVWNFRPIEFQELMGFISRENLLQESN